MCVAPCLTGESFRKVRCTLARIKQKRRRCNLRREKAKERLLIFGQQAREQEPLVIKSTHTDAHENIVRSFVSHSGVIIA